MKISRKSITRLHSPRKKGSNLWSWVKPFMWRYYSYRFSLLHFLYSHSYWVIPHSHSCINHSLILVTHLKPTIHFMAKLGLFRVQFLTKEQQKQVLQMVTFNITVNTLTHIMQHLVRFHHFINNLQVYSWRIFAMVQ